ncbi:MAG TPA: polysaccharide deacetylase family protein [Chthoniobacterales bacterium]
MKDFDTINELVRSANTGLPVVVFHKVDDPRPEANLKEYYVTPEVYRNWVADLASAGFRTVDFSQLAAPAVSLPSPRDKHVLISFDDGFVGTLQQAGVPLQQHGFSAIQFIVADLLGKRNEWDLGKDTAMQPLMDEAQLRDWLALGHQIGAHTRTHPDLTTLSLLEAREQIVGSKKKLEDSFQIPIRHFAYPYGAYTQPLAELVAEAGFETACTTEPGVVTAGCKPFELPRLYFIEKRFRPTRRRTLRSISRGVWRRGKNLFGEK